MTDSEYWLHLARFAVEGKREDAVMMVKRMVHRFRHSDPEMSQELAALIPVEERVFGILR